MNNCRFCGLPHSDWLSCDAAAIMDAPAVPYTSGGQAFTEVVKVLEAIPSKEPFDRSAMMKAWHAEQKAKKSSGKQK
jgi:hypothetical protein